MNRYQQERAALAKVNELLRTAVQHHRSYLDTAREFRATVVAVRGDGLEGAVTFDITFREAEKALAAYATPMTSGGQRHKVLQRMQRVRDAIGALNDMIEDAMKTLEETEAPERDAARLRRDRLRSLFATSAASVMLTEGE